MAWRQDIQHFYADLGPDIWGHHGQSGSELVWRSISGPYHIDDGTGLVLLDPALPEGAVTGLFDQIIDLLGFPS